MSILVKYFGEVRDFIGRKQDELEIDSINLIDMIKKIRGRLGPLSELMLEGDTIKDVFIILVNGKAVKIKDSKNIIIRDGDVVSILPPVGGG